MNAPIKLFSFVPFDRGARFRWTAFELGLSVDETALNAQAGEHKGEAYRKINPFGLVPSCTRDGRNQFESAAMCLSLAESTPGSTLVPAIGSPQRDEFLTWMFFAASTLDNWCERVMVSKRFQPNEEMHALSRERLAPLLAVLEQQLGDKQFLLGDQFSLADILLGHDLVIVKFAECADLIPPKLAAYRDRLAARPAAQRAGLFKV